MLQLAESSQNPLRAVLETTSSCLQRPRFLSGAHRFWGKQIDASVVLGEWEMASRGLDGLWQEMEDRTEAGFTVGEVSLVMKILRLAIQRILNRTNESMKDSIKEDVDELR